MVLSFGGRFSLSTASSPPFFNFGNTHLNILRGGPVAAAESEDDEPAADGPFSAVPSLAFQAEEAGRWADVEFDIRLAAANSPREVRNFSRWGGIPLSLFVSSTP